MLRNARMIAQRVYILSEGRWYSGQSVRWVAEWWSLRAGVAWESNATGREVDPISDTEACTRAFPTEALCAAWIEKFNIDAPCPATGRPVWFGPEIPIKETLEHIADDAWEWERPQ